MTALASTDKPVRCSSWARSVDLDPVGTVGSYAGYLVVEVPLPWPRDVADISPLAPLAALAAANRLRLQAVVPRSAEASPAERSIVLYAGAPESEWFGGYRRFEVPTGDSSAATVEALLAAASTGTPPTDDGRTDILVCTHGRRDVCCGSLGTDLALQLAARDAPAGVRYRRTSHTGGHRFAPTFLSLPSGTGWAFASVEMVEGVLDRSLSFAEVASSYRGCAGLAGPVAQALEREVLRDEGWEVMDRPRRGFPTGEQTSGGAVVAFEVGSPGGVIDRWEGVVAPGRTLPVPDCMHPLSEARKSETEWTVEGLRRL